MSWLLCLPAGCTPAVSTHSSTADKQLIFSLIKQHKLNSALDHCTRTCRKYPLDAQAWFLLGIINGQLDNTDGAIDGFSRSIEINPDSYQSHHYLGTAYLRKGNLERSIGCYESALALNPRDVESYRCLSNIHASSGKFENALQLCNEGISNCPGSAELHSELAKLLIELDDSAAATQHLEIANQLDPGLSEVRYYTAALSGKHYSAASNQSHVAAMFDKHADAFDLHLHHALKYRIPQQIHEAVCHLCPTASHDLDILDLGCGTGLCGVHFRPMALSLAGIDLSSGMLEKARQRGIYDNLIQSELNRYLVSTGDQYDLIIAADVFIYVGDLESAFLNTARVLRAGGLFAFSVESIAGTSFKLRTSGRYAHSSRYIQDLAATHDLEVLEMLETIIRQECFQPVPGHIFVMRSHE